MQSLDLISTQTIEIWQEILSDVSAWPTRQCELVKPKCCAFWKLKELHHTKTRPLSATRDPERKSTQFSCRRGLQTEEKPCEISYLILFWSRMELRWDKVSKKGSFLCSIFVSDAPCHPPSRSRQVQNLWSGEGIGPVCPLGWFAWKEGVLPRGHLSLSRVTLAELGLAVLQLPAMQSLASLTCKVPHCCCVALQKFALTHIYSIHFLERHQCQGCIVLNSQIRIESQCSSKILSARSSAVIINGISTSLDFWPRDQTPIP